ncbi:MAG TPA: Holliday junction branch migration protein RuvA [Candidatus Woesebacteria bacterium]|nr:Holliday junction branch migration protein RuvA [Candidatus Woesebacteria bacterium]HRT40270.1 Holliday junction branch migration protein RuvA [Candidatus Woesebacteria bacterium]
MIASLQGRVERVNNGQIEIEVNGVGYLITLGERLVKDIIEGTIIKLKTYLSISENNLALFGFKTDQEVNLFRMLITVPGVGPKTGSQILGKAEAEVIIRAISEADVDFFSEIKGIGRKTAQRIIIDLKPKLGSFKELDLIKNGELLEDDLYLALQQLGFEGKEIKKVVSKLPKDILTIEEKLQWCLQNL